MSKENRKPKDRPQSADDDQPSTSTGAPTRTRDALNGSELRTMLENFETDRSQRTRSIQPRKSAEKHVRFDDANLRETYKPAGRDYGLMKIDEPVTPYASYDSLTMEDEDTGPKQGSGFISTLVKDELVVRKVPQKVFEKKRSEHYRGEFRKDIPPDNDADDNNANVHHDDSDDDSSLDGSRENIRRK